MPKMHRQTVELIQETVRENVFFLLTAIIFCRRTLWCKKLFIDVHNQLLPSNSRIVHENGKGLVPLLPVTVC